MAVTTSLAYFWHFIIQDSLNMITSKFNYFYRLFVSIIKKKVDWCVSCCERWVVNLRNNSLMWNSLSIRRHSSCEGVYCVAYFIAATNMKFITWKNEKAKCHRHRHINYSLIAEFNRNRWDIYVKSSLSETCKNECQKILFQHFLLSSCWTLTNPTSVDSLNPSSLILLLWCCRVGRLRRHSLIPRQYRKPRKVLFKQICRFWIWIIRSWWRTKNP